MNFSSANQSSRSKQHLLAWFSLLIGAFFYFYEYFIQVSPNIIAPQLMAYFQINATHLSNFTLFYFLAYASMQIPAGVLLDKFGARRLLTLAILCCAVGTLLFAATASFVMAEIARTITGFGSAFALLGTLVIISRSFSQKHFATLAGLLLTVGMSGAICGEAPMAFLIEQMSWKGALHLLGILGIFWALLAFLVIRDPKPSPYVQDSAPTFKQLAINLRSIVKSSKTWLTAAYGCFMFAPTITLGALWGVSFLVAEYQISSTSAAELISLLFIGWALGSPVFGFVSDKLQKRKPLLYLSTIGTLLCTLFLIYDHHISLTLSAILLFLFGFLSSGFILSFSICRELHTFRFSGTALGFMNMMNALGAALIPRLAGMILDYSQKADLHNPLTTFTLNDFKLALSLIPVCLVLSLFILPFIPETHAKSIAKPLP